MPSWLRTATPLVAALGDATLILLAFWTAYWLRYDLGLGGTVEARDREPFSTFVLPAILFAALTLVTFMVRGVYNWPRWVGLLDRAGAVIGGMTTSTAALILSAYFLRFNPSRLTLMFAFALAVAAILAKLAALNRVQHALWERGVGVDRVLVVGSGDTGCRVMRGLLASRRLGVQLVGYVDETAPRQPLSIATERRIIQPEWLGRPGDVDRLQHEYDIDDVIIALPAAAVGQIEPLVEKCRLGGVGFRVVPDVYQLSLDRVELGEVAGVPLIGFRDARITGWHRLAKRTIDVCVSATVLIICALPMWVLSVGIRRDSPGPAFCRQDRVGRDGEPIRVTKFRTMVDGAETQWSRLASETSGADPRLFKLQDDPRLTRMGTHLRRWSLDELPQMWDVLRGTMSLVGPRPPLPEEVSRYDDWHRQRLLVRPGLTGLWQVNGRSNLTFDEMVRLDLYYAEHWSPWLDAKIVLRTIPAVLSGRGAC